VTDPSAHGLDPTDRSPTIRRPRPPDMPGRAGAKPR